MWQSHWQSNANGCSHVLDTNAWHLVLAKGVGDWKWDECKDITNRAGTSQSLPQWWHSDWAWLFPSIWHSLNTLFRSSCYLIPLQPETQPLRGPKATHRPHLPHRLLAPLAGAARSPRPIIGDSTWYSGESPKWMDSFWSLGHVTKLPGLRCHFDSMSAAKKRMFLTAPLYWRFQLLFGNWWEFFPSTCYHH